MVDIYRLCREHAQRQLLWKHSLQDTPIEYRVKLSDFTRNVGFVSLTAVTQTTVYNLWLFPQSMPDYLKYADVLEYLADGATTRSISCRQSTSNPIDLFLIEIKKPNSYIILIRQIYNPGDYNLGLTKRAFCERVAFRTTAYMTAWKKCNTTLVCQTNTTQCLVRIVVFLVALTWLGIYHFSHECMH
jgi:hypothetical protein